MTAQAAPERQFENSRLSRAYTKVTPAQLATAGGLSDNLLWRCRHGR